MANVGTKVRNLSEILLYGVLNLSFRKACESKMFPELDLIVEIEKEGRNFLVGISFNQSRRGIIVSDIRGIFPKDNAEWLNWISQKKHIYQNKKKNQVLINKQRKNLAEVKYLDLNDIANLINLHRNPILVEAKSSQSPQNVASAEQNAGVKDEKFFLSHQDQRLWSSLTPKVLWSI